MVLTAATEDENEAPESGSRLVSGAGCDSVKLG
jgi:hypothetical protein